MKTKDLLERLVLELDCAIEHFEGIVEEYEGEKKQIEDMKKAIEIAKENGVKTYPKWQDQTEEDANRIKWLMQQK